MHKIKLKGFFCLFCILFFWPGKSFAHPHVFVDCTLTFIFDQNGFAGVKKRWVFDEMFSSMILNDFDKDRNLSLDPQEIAAIKKGAFANLKNFNYFTHIQINGKDFKVEFVTDFNAEVELFTDFVGEVEKSSLVYTFFVPCHVKANHHFKQIRIAVFDKEYYTDIALSPGQLSFEEKKGLFFIQCSNDLAHDLTYYYGQVVPEAIVLKFKKK